MSRQGRTNAAWFGDIFSLGGQTNDRRPNLKTITLKQKTAIKKARSSTAGKTC
jgi:hypothetical protein